MPAPKTKQPLKGLGASRFASPSPAAAAIPKISPQAAPQILTQATYHPPSTNSQPTPVPPAAPAAVAVGCQQVRPEDERVEAPTSQYDVIQRSRLRALDIEVEADLELIQQLVGKANCGTQ